MKLKNYAITNDYIKKVSKNIDYNKVITKYYNQFADEVTDDLPQLYNRYIRNADDVAECNSLWFLDKYELQKIKNFKQTYLCKNKFCNNCKKVRQASRRARFEPHLEKYKDNLFHITLTVPNCTGEDLYKTINNMFKSFPYLIRYLNGNKKINDLDFELYGYQGALRSLEVTFKGDSYHPHLHCAFSFSNLKLYKKYVNDFSYSYGNLTRKFSVFEILIQKIWYLLINNIRVTKKNIDELTQGYSCIVDKFKNTDYAELFKYMTKETDENNNVLTYQNFKVLENSLYKVRQIQGYGVFYNIVDDDSIYEEVQEKYDELIKLLNKKEVPKAISETPSELLSSNKYTIISKNKLYSYLRSI